MCACTCIVRCWVEWSATLKPNRIFQSSSRKINRGLLHALWWKPCKREVITLSRTCSRYLLSFVHNEILIRAKFNRQVELPLAGNDWSSSAIIGTQTTTVFAYEHLPPTGWVNQISLNSVIWCKRLRTKIQIPCLEKYLNLFSGLLFLICRARFVEFRAILPSFQTKPKQWTWVYTKSHSSVNGFHLRLLCGTDETLFLTFLKAVFLEE